MKRQRASRALFLAASVGFIIPVKLFAGIDRAFTPASGSWSVAGNWSPTGVPNAGDFPNIGNEAVTFDFGYNAGGGLIDLLLSGGSITQSDASTRMIVTQEEMLSGAYTQSAGINSTGSIVMQSGSYALSGTGSLATGTVLINQSSFTQSGGGESASEILIANTVNGAASESFSGGTLNTVFLAVGAGGNGTLDQSGGTITISGEPGLSVASFAGSGGTVTISSGAVMQTNEVLVGGGILVSRGVAHDSAGGTGIMNVDGGHLAINGRLKIFNTLGTVLNFSAGTIDAISIDTSGTPADFNWTGGALNLTNTTLEVDNIGTLGNSLSINSNQSLSVTGVLGVGSFGAGTVAVAGGTVNVNGDLNIAGQGTVLFSSGALSASSIQLTGGGRMLMSAGAGKTLIAKSLSIDAASKLDLSDNAAVVDYTGTSPLASIRALIVAGRAGGGWTGNGLTSSAAAAVAADASDLHKTALGFADASSIGSPASFHGVAIDNTAVLVLYTLVGDANLDGQVDARDFAALAADFGQSTPFWSGGDFNDDGVVNALDFDALAANFGATFTPAALGTVVPEPMGLAICTSAIVLMNHRRRRD